MVRQSAHLLALAALLAACSAGDPTPSASEASQGSGSTPASAPAASAPNGSDVAGVCTPPVLCGGELTPGVYGATTAGFQLTFTVGEGWRGNAYGDLGFDLVQLGDGEPQLMSAVPYGGVVYADVCSGAQTMEIGPGAADLVAYVSSRPGITPRGVSTETTIGGLDGLQIDLDAGDPGCVSDPPGRLWLWNLDGVTDFHLNAGETARIIALDADGGVIVFVVETFDPPTFDALIHMLQPTLDSMTFGG